MENPYVVVRPHDGYVSCYLHDRYGSGRNVRRRLLATRHLPRIEGERMSDLLRRLADALDSPWGEQG